MQSCVELSSTWLMAFCVFVRCSAAACSTELLAKKQQFSKLRALRKNALCSDVSEVLNAQLPRHLVISSTPLPQRTREETSCMHSIMFPHRFITLLGFGLISLDFHLHECTLVCAGFLLHDIRCFFPPSWERKSRISHSFNPSTTTSTLCLSIRSDELSDLESEFKLNFHFHFEPTVRTGLRLDLQSARL